MAVLGFISRLSVTPGLIIGERADLLTLSRESRNKAGTAALPGGTHGGCASESSEERGGSDTAESRLRSDPEP